jgi:hypothetical protein
MSEAKEVDLIKICIDAGMTPNQVVQEFASCLIAGCRALAEHNRGRDNGMITLVTVDDYAVAVGEEIDVRELVELVSGDSEVIPDTKELH